MTLFPDQESSGNGDCTDLMYLMTLPSVTRTLLSHSLFICNVHLCIREHNGVTFVVTDVSDFAFPLSLSLESFLRFRQLYSHPFLPSSYFSSHCHIDSIPHPNDVWPTENPLCWHLNEFFVPFKFLRECFPWWPAWSRWWRPKWIAHHFCEPKAFPSRNIWVENVVCVCWEIVSEQCQEPIVEALCSWVDCNWKGRIEEEKWEEERMNPADPSIIKVGRSLFWSLSTSSSCYSLDDHLVPNDTYKHFFLHTCLSLSSLLILAPNSRFGESIPINCYFAAEVFRITVCFRNHISLQTRVHFF